MPFVAAVAFVMYQKVFLLLDDITIVGTEGDERCFGRSVKLCIELCSAFQNYTTVIFSTEIHANNCVVVITD